MKHNEVTDEILSAYFDNELPIDQAGAVAEHIESCEDCAQRIAAYEQLVVAYAETDGEDIAPTRDLTRAALATAAPRRRSFWLPRALAASIAAVLFVALSLVYTNLNMPPTGTDKPAAPLIADNPAPDNIQSEETRRHLAQLGYASGEGQQPADASDEDLAFSFGNTTTVAPEATPPATAPLLPALANPTVPQQPAKQPKARTVGAWSDDPKIAATQLASLNTDITRGALRVLKDDGEVVECPLTHTDVQASISGFISRVTVTQTFANPFKENIEATYVFPLPHKAAVDAMNLVVGDRRVVGIIKRREVARQIYDKAIKQGATAALLDQERPNIFTQMVGNIRPGKPVNIEISYVDVLEYDMGVYTFHFPMVVGPRYNPGMSQSGHSPRVPDAARITPPVLKPGQRNGHDISLAVALDAGVPIRDLKIDSHKVKLERDGKSRASVALSPADAMPNKDFVLRYNVLGEKPEIAVLSHFTPEAGGHFMLMVQPKIDEAMAKAPPREMVFLIDVSGSMSGKPTAKVKEALKKFLERSKKDDTMQVITFAGSASKLFEKPVPINDETLTKALNFTQSRAAGGGTNMLEGVKMTLNEPVDPDRARIVVMLTDGYIGNEPEIIKEVGTRAGDQIRFWAIGIGSSPNRHLIDGVAKQGGGMGKDLALNQDPTALVEEIVERIHRAQLAKLEIDWNELPVFETYPRRIPELWAGRPVVVFGRYEGGAQSQIKISGVAEGKPVSFTVDVSLPEVAAKHDVLSPVWARKKIESLMSDDLYANNPKVAAEVTRVALDHKLMSQYTSFVAVDEKSLDDMMDEPVRPPRQIAIPIPLPEGVRYEGIFGGEARDDGNRIVRVPNGKLFVGGGLSSDKRMFGMTNFGIADPVFEHEINGGFGGRDSGYFGRLEQINMGPGFAKRSYDVWSGAPDEQVERFSPEYTDAEIAAARAEGSEAKLKTQASWFRRSREWKDNFKSLYDKATPYSDNISFGTSPERWTELNRIREGRAIIQEAHGKRGWQLNRPSAQTSGGLDFKLSFEEKGSGVVEILGDIPTTDLNYSLQKTRALSNEGSRDEIDKLGALKALGYLSAPKYDREGESEKAMARTPQHTMAAKPDQFELVRRLLESGASKKNDTPEKDIVGVTAKIAEALPPASPNKNTPEQKKKFKPVTKTEVTGPEDSVTTTTKFVPAEPANSVAPEAEKSQGKIKLSGEEQGEGKGRELKMPTVGDEDGGVKTGEKTDAPVKHKYKLSDIGASAEDYAALKNVITSSVEPETWDVWSGGSDAQDPGDDIGHWAADKDALTVVHSEKAHKQIKSLLDQLKANPALRHAVLAEEYAKAGNLEEAARRFQYAFLLDASNGGRSGVAARALPAIQYLRTAIVAKHVKALPALANKLDLELRDLSLDDALKAIAKSAKLNITRRAGSESDAAKLLNVKSLRVTYLDLRGATAAQALEWLLTPMKLTWSVSDKGVTVGTTRRMPGASGWVYDVSALAAPEGKELDAPLTREAKAVEVALEAFKKAREAKDAEALEKSRGEALKLYQQYYQKRVESEVAEYVGFLDAVRLAADTAQWYVPGQILVYGGPDAHKRVDTLLTALRTGKPDAAIACCEPMLPAQVKQMQELQAKTTVRWPARVEAMAKQIDRDAALETLTAMHRNTWNLLAGSRTGAMDPEMLTELSVAWRSESAKKFAASPVAIRSLWAITQAARQPRSAAELKTLAATAYATAKSDLGSALDALEKNPANPNALQIALYASQAHQNALALKLTTAEETKAFFETASKQMETLKGGDTYLAGILLGRGISVQGPEPLQPIRAAAQGNDGVVLAALAARQLGGDVWQAFRAALKEVTAQPNLDGNVVVWLNSL